VAGALLVRENDMFVGIAPDMWRVTDRNEDGKWDTKVSISHGYGVHVGFGGHGMSGAVEGPDGKIYWGIGDIGANITTPDGRHFKYPNQGVLVRSNPDGSDFEVFAAGLRNVHEFTFDEYGNIIGADNDGDHPGESERLVYIVQGSDAGWRSNWQYGKYTDPDNNDYNVWMDEKLFKTRWEGQASYIIPPIMNYHNGPTGMIYNPGTALSSHWKNKFFLVEFVGNPARSPIWAFSLKPSGASFELDKEEVVLRGILPTGIRFGPDGALYAADWVNGWNTKNYGRVWKIDVPDTDLKEERRQTESLLQLDYSDQSDRDLYDLLFYPDMRVRQKAQFELANRKRSGKDAFQEALEQKENQLARIHAIWGIGQLIRKDEIDGSILQPYLQDSDPEIVAQSAKMLGDVRYSKAGDMLMELLQSPEYRVRFFAAEALGRIEYTPAVPAIFDMLESNNDEDVYLRHAGVLALARIGAADEAARLSDHQSEALRMAAVLILRRLQDERVQQFLDDPNEYIVTEAARAIHDDWSIEGALPALAAYLENPDFSNEPLIRRAISAASRLGGKQNSDRLLSYAGRETAQPELRSESLAALTDWGNPSVLDRVDGRYRGLEKRDSSYVMNAIEPVLGQLLASKDPLLVISAAKSIGHYKIKSHAEAQLEILKTHPDPAVRSAMIVSLGESGFENMKEVLITGSRDSSPEVRTAALGLIGDVEMDAESFRATIDPVFRIGTVKEQQEILSVMRIRPAGETSPVLEELLTRWKRDELPEGITLELFEAVDSTRNEELI
ncbi:MAG: HEAT repeat domain-containing protein, partial [Cyclobacteriaceae bacterium]